ncbi:MAG: ABC transporter ATP-binding protein [Bdellovibrionales bacterium]|nr:ABC transporter ATP-binding protein [Bdellovibrionales bacterium]
MQSLPNQETALEFSNVGVFYPSKTRLRSKIQKIQKGYWAIKDVSFSINKGDVLGIIGSNGAGKSTTLAVASSIMKPDKGTVNTFGNTVTLLSLSAGLVSNLSGRRNIYLIGLTLGIEEKVITEKIGRIIRFSELGDFIDKPVETYSSGMKSRLGFSISIILRPDIMLIDEVLGVGDKRFKRKSSKAIREKLSGEMTAIIVSHNLVEIEELCNKVLWIDDGVSRMFGTPQEVIQAYNEFE